MPAPHHFVIHITTKCTITVPKTRTVGVFAVSIISIFLQYVSTAAKKTPQLIEGCRKIMIASSPNAFRVVA